VSAGGIGTSARFAAIFAERDIGLVREWSATGARPNALAVTEQIVESFMKTHSVRSAQLTILRNGAIALERAYSWSDAPRKL
jgi:hypothetical protein